MVTVHSAAGLRKADLIGKSDPFVVITVAGEKAAQTEVIDNTQVGCVSFFLTDSFKCHETSLQNIARSKQHLKRSPNILLKIGSLESNLSSTDELQTIDPFSSTLRPRTPSGPTPRSACRSSRRAAL